MAKLTVISSCCGLRLRTDGCNGPLILANEDDTGCCCDDCTYEFCIVNANQILDNSWDVYVNNNLVGNYSGAPFSNICLDIEPSFLNIPGNNTLKFTRQNCVNDDLFEFEVRKTCDEEVTILYTDSSGLLNSPGGPGGNCTDNEFTKNFTL